MTIQLSGQILQFSTPMMRGVAVQRVQAALIGLDLLPRGDDDGLFGPATRDAIREFQRDRGLSIDGKVGPNTAKALNATLSGGAPLRGASGQLARNAGAFGSGGGIGGVSGQGPQVVDPSLLPAANPKRVILHWTGGAGRASELDKKHYHFVIEEDGTIVQGIHSISANDRSHRHPRASHTRNLNSHSVGISLCGMHNAVERPFNAGRFPLREVQVNVMARLVAQICARYGIPVSRETVLGHGEVQNILDVAQSAKWDPLVLPWRRDLDFRGTGDYLRGLVQNALNHGSGQSGEDDEEEGVLPRPLVISGNTVDDAVIEFDTVTWLTLGPLCQAMGWPEPDLLGDLEEDSRPEEASGVRIIPDETPIVMTFKMVPTSTEGQEMLCVRADELAEALELGITAKSDGSLELTGEIGGVEQAPQDPSKQVRFVTIQRGDTLSKIAARELGDSAKWTTLRDENGNSYDAESARRISAGDRVMLPDGATTMRSSATPPSDLSGLLDQATIDQLKQAVGAAASPAINRKRAEAALEPILRACYKWGVTDSSHIAYMLATAQHETNFGHPMVELWGPSSWQRNYRDHKLNRGDTNADPDPDGKKYRGRGYVQITFHYNYKRFGEKIGQALVDDRKLAEKPEIAAEIMVIGMSQRGFGFTAPNRILSSYGSGRNFDFVNARRMINGDTNFHEERYGTTKGKGIAERARKFRDALESVDLPQA